MRRTVGGLRVRRCLHSSYERSLRLLSTAAPPVDLPLPDLGEAICSKTAQHLRQHGYAVVDGLCGSTWAHLLRDDIITLAERQLLQRNATHLVRPDGTTELLPKNQIFEAEITCQKQDKLVPRLTRLWGDDSLRIALEQSFWGKQEAVLQRQTLKVQLNAGGGACFPMHFDSDRAIDGRVFTAILYLNPDWSPSDGGELRLLPWPGSPGVDIEPCFDRFVIFSSQDMLHRVLPSAQLRMCLTLWFYGKATPSSFEVDCHGISGDMQWLLSTEARHLFTRYVYAEEWATSIVESHAPSAQRNEALQTHWDDIAKIEAGLAVGLLAFNSDRNCNDMVGQLRDCRQELLSGTRTLKEARQQWFPDRNIETT